VPDFHDSCPRCPRCKQHRHGGPCELWECDGGDLQGTHDEVVEHIRKVNHLADGTLKPIEDVVCWGAMQVGGPAWQAFQDGQHPMDTLMNAVRKHTKEILGREV
jgi:hypothetical protein